MLCVHFAGPPQALHPATHPIDGCHHSQRVAPLCLRRQQGRRLDVVVSASVGGACDMLRLAARCDKAASTEAATCHTHCTALARPHITQ